MNRLATPILLLIIAMLQGMGLYRQYHTPTGLPGAPFLGTLPNRPTRPEPVTDALKNTILDLAGIPVKGSNAKVVLIEFSDYECPFCARHATATGPQLEQKYVSSGQLRYAFVNDPLPIHANAKLLASAAICAGKQGRYWEMHDRLFNDKPNDKEQVQKIAKDVGLKAVEFQQCLERNADTEKVIQRDVEIAQRFNLTGTPSFALGIADSTGKVQVQKFIRGAQPFAVFDKAISDILAKAS